MKGKFIIIESGTDGSGKATQTKKLYERLVNEGYNIKKITFPNYESPACMPIKMYLEGVFGKNAKDVNAYTASTFFAIDRFASYKTDWEDFYKKGGIIISDRYTTSNMVHQAAKIFDKEEREKYLDWLYDLEFKKFGLPIPDCVLFLDVPTKITKELMKDRENKFTGEKEKDIHENNHKYLEDCYNNSLEIVEKYSWEKIQCYEDNKFKSIEEIHEDIYNKVKNLI